MAMLLTMRVILALTIGAVLSSCSYAGKVTVAREGGLAALSQEEVAQARSIVADVSREFGLEPSPELERYKEVGASLGHRVLGRYSRGRDRETDWSNILVIQFVDETNDRPLVVLIRDWSSLRPTTFTDSLRQRLVDELSKALPGASVRYERVYDNPIFYVP